MSFVGEHRDRFGVEPILRVPDIPTATYYDWVARQRTPSRRRVDDQVLAERIRRIHDRSGGTYGAPRVHAQLRRDGTHTARKRVERLMRSCGLQGAFVRKRWRCSTRQDPKATPAPDLVNRDFTAAAPNRLWVADISKLPTGEGPVWLGERPRRLLPADRGLEGKRPGRCRAGPRGAGVCHLGPWPRRRPCPAEAHPPQRPGLPVHRDPVHGSGWTTPASAPRWARSAIPTTTPWPRTSSPS